MERETFNLCLDIVEFMIRSDMQAEIRKVRQRRRKRLRARKRIEVEERRRKGLWVTYGFQEEKPSEYPLNTTSTKGLDAEIWHHAHSQMETSDESDSDTRVTKVTANDEMNSTYVCDICGLVYKRRKAFEIHIGMHDGHSPFECHICRKQFTQNVGLQKHLLIHSGVPQYKCEFCDRSFIHEKTYKHHLTSHNGEKFVNCDVCHEGFNSSADLRRHQRVHTGEKPYSCDICGQHFTQNYNMLAHKRKIHENPDRKRKYNVRRQCPLCSRTYERNQLAEHLSQFHSMIQSTFS